MRCSTVSDGDFHRIDVPFDELERRRRAFVDLPWTMLDQQHGVAAIEVTEPGGGDGAVADVAATGIPDAVIGCWVGDCAPVVLVGRSRRIAVAHAGWRGLAAGVIDAAIEALDESVASVVLGPSIHPCCYEFGADDLAAVAAGVHAHPDELSGVTRSGRLALDVPAAVAAAVVGTGAPVERLGACTGCTYPGFSHRVRRERQRHVLAVWQVAP